MITYTFNCDQCGAEESIDSEEFMTVREQMNYLYIKGTDHQSPEYEHLCADCCEALDQDANVEDEEEV